MIQWKRRLFHFCSISLLLVAALLAPEGIFLICLGGVAIALIILEWSRLTVSASLNRWLTSRLKAISREKESYQPWSSTYVILSSLLLFLFFQKDIALAALLFLAIGNPVAGIVGEKLGGEKVGGKSLRGFFAFFLCCLVFGILLDKTTFSIGLPAILIGSLFAALAELLPLPLNDNLTIPLTAALAMTAVNIIP